MVLFVLVAYTAIGGLLFRAWEGWQYFDAFYFCFITMATVGRFFFSKKLKWDCAYALCSDLVRVTTVIICFQ